MLPQIWTQATMATMWILLTLYSAQLCVADAFILIKVISIMLIDKNDDDTNYKNTKQKPELPCDSDVFIILLCKQ